MMSPLRSAWTVCTGCLLVLAPISTAARAQAAPAPQTAAAPAPSAAEQELLDAESARFHALLQGDTAAVKLSIAPDLVYIHNTGMSQNAAQYTGMLDSGKMHYKSIEPSQRTAKIYGITGITHGVLAQDAGGDRQSVAAYTAVYLRREGRWQLVSWQTTPMNNVGHEPPPGSRPDAPH